MVSRILALAVLAGCGVDNDDSNPLAGDRVVDGVITFDGHADLDGYAFQSTTPAGNRASEAAGGQFLMQLAFVADVTEPTVSVGFTLASPTGVVEPGTYDVRSEVDDADDVATLILTVGSNAQGYAATGIGTSGTFFLDTFEDGRAEGSFDLTGTASWTAGTGAPEYALEGTFSAVPITAL